MEENIFDKIKSVVRKPEPKPVEPRKATKIADLELEKNKREIFTLNEDHDKNKK